MVITGQKAKEEVVFDMARKVKIGSKVKLKDNLGNTTKITILSKKGADDWNKHKPKTVEQFERFTKSGKWNKAQIPQKRGLEDTWGI